MSFGTHMPLDKDDLPKEGSVGTEDRDEYVAEMMAAGFSIIVPKTNELFVDLDTEDQYRRFEVMFDTMHVKFPGITCEIKESAGGYPKRHAYITLTWDVSEYERIAWQAILCSDPYREMCSMKRVMTGSLPATIFKERR